MPTNKKGLLANENWQASFFSQVFQMLSDFFTKKTNLIWHVQVLFLARLASVFKNNLGGAIVSHVHIIPWKFLFDSNEFLFNTLYQSYIDGKHQKVGFDRFEKYAYNASDAIICVSMSGKDHVMNSYGIPDKIITIIPNGLKDIHKKKLSVTNTNLQKPVILFVGRLVSSKGIWDMLDALSSIRETGIDFKVMLVGNCPFQTQVDILEKYDSLDLEIKGKVPKKQLYEIYKTSNIGIIPSKHEQCSFVAIEMLMHGLPIVASNIDGLSEIFQNELNALLVPLFFNKINGLTLEKNILKNNIIRLLVDKDLRNKLSANARKAFIKKYAFDLMMKKTLNCYFSVLEKEEKDENCIFI